MIAVRALFVALSALALAGCGSPSRQAEVPSSDQHDDAAARELRAEDELETRIRANMANQGAQDDLNSAAEDAAFLANLDSERNQAVAAALNAVNAQEASDRRDRLGEMVARDAAAGDQARSGNVSAQP